MVEPEHAKLSVRRQCNLLGFSRSGLYESRKTQPSQEDAEMMKQIDHIYTWMPCYGSRRIATHLRRHGQCVNRKRIQRLMRKMGLEGVAPRRRTTRPHPSHKVYPYLLRNLDVVRPNQVWCADITYVPMKRGSMYLTAVMDWYSRRVLAWELSNSLDSSFCVEALQRALAHYGPPEIFNTDQGCQFTSEAFTSVLRNAGIRISMDGRGRALDNVFIERLWRSVKHEDIYLRDYENVPELYRGLIRYFHHYNNERFHQGLDDKTPDEVYRTSPEPPAPMGAPFGEPQTTTQTTTLCQATP
jgi:putative transposase